MTGELIPRFVHDPLCPVHGWAGLGPCRCRLIRKVRADERAQMEARRKKEERDDHDA